MGVSVYVADDERDIRQLVETFFRNEGFDVECFQNGMELYQRMKQQQPDLIILDIMMPGMDGLTLCRELRNMSDVPIIFVSAKGTEFDRITGISIGGDDYLVKPFSPTELVVRAKALLRRAERFKNPVLEDGLLRYGNIELMLKKHTVMISDREFPATPTEFDFLSYMISNKDRAVSRKELLKELWQFDFDSDTKVSDDLVKRLRKKLKDYEATVQIDSVWGFGFKLSIIAG